MRPWRAALGAWERFWFRPGDAEPLAAFRVLLGGFLLVYLAVYLPHVPLMYSSHGVYTHYLAPDYAPPPALAWLAYLALMVASGALMLGWRTRWAAGITLALFAYHYFIYLAEKHSSFDRLLAVLLAVLCLADSGACWSLDARRKGARPHVAVWGSRLVRFQIIMLYLGAGLWKAVHPAWQSGALLYATLQSAWATPPAFSLVQALPDAGAWQALSLGAVGIELLLGILLWIPRTRAVGVVLASGFHLTNWVLLSIPEFMVCLTTYPLFLKTAQVQRVVAALRAPPRRALARLATARSPNRR